MNPVDLFPPPTEASFGPDTIPLPSAVRAGAVPEALRGPAVAWRLGRVAAGEPDTDALALEIRHAAVKGPESYLLEIRDRALAGEPKAQVTAEDASGLFHALTTLERLLHGARKTKRLALGRILDRPDFALRGVLLDVSRCRVPRLETLFEWVDLLSGWKINQLQLYTEHTFAYTRHEEVWAQASPLTAEDVRALDARCAERNIELVPNQQSFGHMHHWLKRDRYRSLAECPAGVDHPFSDAREPFSLCPGDPAVLELLAELYDELLPNFTSGLLHVGLDETFDLGQGRSKAACEERGVGRVYFEHVRRVHELVKARGKRMMFWADVAGSHPELLGELPSDVVACIWGYEGDHRFGPLLAALRAHGIECVVCPGTSGWQSIGGRTPVMLANVRGAAQAGRAGGARGYLMTDWGDRGHLQPELIAFPGWAAAAAAAWNSSAGCELGAEELAAVLDRDALGLPGPGRILWELGAIGPLAGIGVENASPLFRVLVAPRGPFPPPELAGLDERGLERSAARLATLRDELGSVTPGAAAPASARRACSELQWALDLLDFACDLGRARLADPDLVPAAAGAEAGRGPARELGRRLDGLVERHLGLWEPRFRPGGRAESVAWLTRCRSAPPMLSGP